MINRKQHSPPYSQKKRPHLLLTNLLVLALFFLVTAPTMAKPTGYQEYYVLGYEEHVWRAFDAIYEDSISSNICSTVSLVATADYQVLYYDHWEDGYEADLLNPIQATTKIYGDGNPSNGGTGSDVLLAGDDINLTSDRDEDTINGYVPVDPRDPAQIRYDGGDRIITSGGPVDLTHAMWPFSYSWVGGAWEVYSRQAYANSHVYRLPVGEDLYDLGMLYRDFRDVYLQLTAFEDNTTISIDNGAGEIVNLTLDRGQTYSSMGYVNSTPARSIVINTGTVIRANKPTQVGLITGSDSVVGEGFQGRFLVVLPNQLWGADYVVPVPGGNPGDEAEIYLSNPNDFPITIEAYDDDMQNTFVISPTNHTNSIVAYAGAIRGSPIPQGSATRFTSSDGVFSAIVCADTGDTDYDWGVLGIPAKYLTQDYYVSWAPGDQNIPPQNNGSPVWVTPLTDETTFYVDFSPIDGVVDQTFTLDVLQQRRLFDPDNDNTGMHVWATEEFAIFWGEDPNTAEVSIPYLDLGFAILPLLQRWLDPVLVLDKTAQPTILPPAGGTVTYAMVAQAHNAPLFNVNFTDTLPANWSYVPDSTQITYPNGQMDTPEPTIEGQELYWNLSYDLGQNQGLTLTFQAQITTAGSVGTTVWDDFESNDYTGGRNWSGSWQEGNDDGLPHSGYVQVRSDAPFVGDYHLSIRGANRSISRTVDLSRFTMPMLRFMRHIDTAISNAFYLDIHDGTGWTTVLTWDSSSEESYLQETVDLTPYATPIAIRFRSGDLETGGLNIDQIEIKDAIATNVNRGEAIGKHQYADVLFNPYDEATVYISPINVTKSVNTSRAEIGDTLVYTLTYANHNDTTTATNIALHDPVPIQHVTFESASPGGTYNGASGTIAWTLSELAPQASGTVTFSVTVNDFVENGTIIQNAAYISSDQTVRASSNEVRTTVTAPDVLFTKSGPTVANPGEIITYTISYQNISSAPATEVSIQDRIPISTTYVTGSLAIITDTEWVSLTDATGDDIGAYISPTLVITPGIIPAQGEGQIRFAVQVEEGLVPGSIIRNWAILDRALDIPRESNLSITRISELLINKQAKTANSAQIPRLSAAPGGLITYTLTYVNVSTTNTQTNVFLREAIPDYTHFVTASTPISYSWNHGATWVPTQPVTLVTHIRWHDPLLPTDTQRNVNLTVRLNDTLPPQTTIDNIAYISSTQTGSYFHEWIPSNQVEVETVDLWVNKDVSRPNARAGEAVTYTIAYGNRGSVDAYDIQIYDVLPTNTHYISGTIWGPGANASSLSTLTWQIESLAPGSTGEVGYVVSIDNYVPSGTTITNTAALSSPYGIEVSAPAFLDVTAIADLAITKAAPVTAIAGRALTYTLTVTNLGPSTARAVTITDILPADVIFGGIISSDLPAPTVQGRAVTWLTPTLAPGAAASVVLTAAVHPNVTGTLTNTATIKAATADLQLANNTYTTTTTVGATADLAIAKAAPVTAIAGRALTYTLTVTNLGPSTARAVTITDILPADVIFGGVVSSPFPTLSIAGQRLTWSTPTMPVGPSAPVVFTVTVRPDASGTLTNTAIITSALHDPILTNNVALASTTLANWGTIHGYVFHDLDGDGTQDAAEAGISDVVITLDGTITVTTDVSGTYAFTTTTPGMHTVVETDPEVYVPSAHLSGIGEPALGPLDLPGYFSTTPNEVHVNVILDHNHLVDFGNAPTNAGFSSIYGTVFEDFNGDGVQNAREPGIPGPFIATSSPLTLTTDLYGRYTFSITTPNIYVVTETNPIDHYSTTPDEAHVRAKLGNGYQVDFGNAPAGSGFAAIYGIAFNDADSDGTFGRNEVGISGVTITLDSAITTTTNPQGSYALSTTAPTTHTVAEVEPLGFDSSTPNVRQLDVDINHGYRVDFGNVEIGICDPDIYEPDDTPTQASPFIVGTSQAHQFCDDATDWIHFSTEAHTVYTLTTAIWGTRADTILSLFDTDGQTLLITNDNYYSGTAVNYASRIIWRAPSDGSYYANVANQHEITGTHTNYTLRIEGIDPPTLYLPIVMRSS